jgi:hypothetical protein
MRRTAGLFFSRPLEGQDALALLQYMPDKERTALVTNTGRLFTRRSVQARCLELFGAGGRLLSTLIASSSH